jgi:hypothetical protein
LQAFVIARGLYSHNLDWWRKSENLGIVVGNYGIIGTMRRCIADV